MYEQLIAIILVAVVLGADSFSLALGMGLKGVSLRYELKFSWLVGIFHVFMPLIGLMLGIAIGNLIGFWAVLLGAAVLAYIGADMIWKGYQASGPRFFAISKPINSGEDLAGDGEGWITLTLLTVSVSIDALTVGFSLGTLFTIPVFYTVLIIGCVAGTMTMIGFKGARLFTRMIGAYAQIIGGLVLIALAVKMI